MLAGELGNFLFFFIPAFGADQRQNTVFFLGGFLGDLPIPEGVDFFVQLYRTTLAAEGPMAVRIVFDFAIFGDAMSALVAVMLRPFPAFRTDSVGTAKIFGSLGTTVLAPFTVGTGVRAVLANTAVGANCRTVHTDFTAFAAQTRTTISAIAAFPAHFSRTVLADAAVGTECIETVVAFSAVLAPGFRAVHADQTAILADFRAVAALTAILAEQILCAFPTDIAGSTEFVRTV
jgi:hypothetical protein